MGGLADAQSPDAPAWYRTERADGAVRLIVGGIWAVAEAPRLDPLLHAIDFAGASSVEFDAAGVSLLDTSGAWLLLRTRRQAAADGRHVGDLVVPARFQALLATLESEMQVRPVELPERHSFQAFLQRTGRGTVHALCTGRDILGFLGLVTVETVQTIVQPWRRLRLTALVTQIEETGITALPILGLLAFLLGIVLAYQGADQLRRFGAEIYTVNLVSVSILREIGGLIAAIIVAGRSGSAFTAQIGTMKVNEELDAMEVMGLNVIEVLVMPRVFALAITLPFLTFYADVMGLVGGAVMCNFDLGITVPVYLRQLQSAVTLSTLAVGLIKAPVFAFIIAEVGCFEGLRVERNAGSVGRRTTQSVVESIFLVIVFDAAFSVMFSILGL
jgi:phospholipid/cholesterol/gamma-HCH transport system permease protein